MLKLFLLAVLVVLAARFLVRLALLSTRLIAGSGGADSKARPGRPPDGPGKVIRLVRCQDCGEQIPGARAVALRQGGHRCQRCQAAAVAG